MLGLTGFGLFVVEIVILLVPGFIIGRVCGLPSWSAAASAPLLAFGVTTLAGPASATMGLRWNALVFLIACGLLAAVGFG
ncbi:MAG: copper-transporting ATPase, partial [Acidobacteriota bacterium]|nr:copper-transporting ATPase [Acidobacteriota bacterium]